MSEKLTELLERVRAATGPDRELDANIAVTFLGMEIKREPNNRNWRIGHRQTKTRDAEPWVALPFYTESIDAALALVDRSSPIGPMAGHELVNSLARDGEEFWTFRIRHYSDEEGEAPTVYWETAHDAPSAIIGSLLQALIAQAETP